MWKLMTENMKIFSIKNSFDGIDIPVVLFGASNDGINKKAYVFFHGLGTDKYEYLNFYELLGNRLSLDGHRVVCFDARCHGDSDQPFNEFTLSNLISDGIEVIKWVKRHLMVESLSLFGTSFGAIPAICIASLFPELITDLKLLAPVSDFEKLYTQPITKARADKYNGLLEKVILNAGYVDITDRIKFNRTLVTEFALIKIDEILSKLNLPTDIMHGTSDSAIPIILSETAEKQNPPIALHTFNNMDHGWMECGDESGYNPQSLNNIERIIKILQS